MRWESLFADLESQLQARAAADLREEIAESTRVERTRQSLTERLAAYQGAALMVRVAADRELHGRLGPVGPDYLCLAGSAHKWLIRTPAIQAVALPEMQHARAGVPARSRWGAVVRALLRDRSQVEVHAATGALLGQGTLVQVAEDFLVLASHPRDEYARSRTVQGHVLVPYQGMGWLSVKSPD